VLLVGLIGYGVWWLRESSAALNEAERVSLVSDAYEDALESILQAEVTSHDLLREPTEEARSAFDLQVFRAAAAISFIQNNGDAGDRALVQQLIDVYAPQLIQINNAFDAAAAGETIGDERLPANELISDVKRFLEEPERQSQVEAVEALQRYRDAQQVQATIVSIALFLGLPVMGGLLLVIRVFERRENDTNLNLERLEQAALTDSLTGLGNHRAYQEELQLAVDRAHGGHVSLSLAVIDVDEFKEVNDTAGHARGDQILFQLGRLLGQIGEARDKRFRVGGDEFAVIMPGSTEDEARVAMDRFRALAGLTGATVSIGVAQLGPSEDTEILREKADSTLYTAKRRGRNAVCTFSGDNAEQKVVTQAKIQAVRELLRDDRIDIAFQPVLDSGQRSIIGYEALARIPDVHQLDGPQEAFDIAERIGHSHDLDLLCIRESLRHADKIEGTQVLFLNISPRTLEYAGFSASALVNLVEDAGLLPAQVCFEITERSVAPIEVIQREAAALKAAGFKIALDDVGAGNAGLEMMRRLQVDLVNIY
jgi:diguanylate cyclase (GGDEF)-like protein